MQDTYNPDITNWTSLLTVRCPDLSDFRQVQQAIQSEIIRPLSSLLSNEVGGCKLCGIGVATSYDANNRRANTHVHILISSSKPLPVISSRQDPLEYARWRRQLINCHSRKACMLPTGKNVIELTPVIDQLAVQQYVDDHYSRSDAQQLTFSLRGLTRLFYQQREAA